MAAIERLNSVSGQLRPLRAKFAYFFPLLKSQQEVQDPETPDSFWPNGSKQYQAIEKQVVPLKSQHKSWCTPMNIDTNSDCRSFLSVSIQLPKITKKYLDDYYFIKNLGKGAYGRVEKLRDKMGDKIYAGKILLKTPNSKANRYKNTKLEDEIRIYEKLNHPNIPQLHQIYTWKNQYTLILEYVSGQDLHSLLHDRLIQEQKIARIMYQILDTLEYLHGLNIVHHDIKPQNIIFDPESEMVRIFDFGEAVFLTSGSEAIMDQGGTLAYFAPECFEGVTSAKLDVWAAGVILFYLLSGMAYFNANTKMQVKKDILQKPVAFEGKYWDERSNLVKDLILKMLQRDYTKRISAKEAKQHPWIIENTKNWQNPSKKFLKGAQMTMKRSCSIDKSVTDRKGKKISLEMRSAWQEGHNKVSRFCECAQTTPSRS